MNRMTAAEARERAKQQMAVRTEQARQQEILDRPLMEEKVWKEIHRCVELGYGEAWLKFPDYRLHDDLRASLEARGYRVERADLYGIVVGW